jgi:hypothetical protein
VTRDPFAGLAATLAGEPPRFEVDPYQRLAEVVAILRDADSEAASFWADALTQYADRGGDLTSMLGLKLRRGGSFDRPGRREKLKRRDGCIRQVAAQLPGGTAEKARALSAMLRSGDQRTAVFREEHPDAPTSVAQLVRLIRATPEITES